tara:strand:- start:317 stop:463 length:147 start_codon:yes stop_codon:yes gene_type:complete
MRTILQFVADQIIIRMETTTNMKEVAKLYEMGMELVNFSFMFFAIELD